MIPARWMAASWKCESLMAAQLGHVLYWALRGIALLLVGAAVYGAVDDFRRGIDLEADGPFFGTILTLALVMWLLGRGCRFVLAERSETRR
jgi:hypothetical protein